MDSNTKPSQRSTAHPHAHAYSSQRNEKEYSSVQQTQRRYYTPRSISQQAADLNLLEEQSVDHSTVDHSYIKTLRSESQNLALHLPVSREYIRTRRQLLQRPLGGIEQMYNIYSSQGTDIICLMTKIESIYPVKASAVVDALDLLQQRHPLFRMSIRKSQHYNECRLDFVENEKATFDFAVYDRLDWLQCLLEELDHKSISAEKSPSLIRCRMLNSQLVGNKCKSKTISKPSLLAEDVDSDSSDIIFNHQTTFLFIMHHSIMDGGYSLWMFQEFVNFLDAVVMKMNLGRVKELPLLPPFENVFTFNCSHDNGRNVKLNNSSESSLSFCHDSTDDTLLKAYDKTFQEDIDVAPDKKFGNGCLVFKFSKEKTQTFVQMTKSKNCTPKGAVVAASTLALLELVYHENFWDECNDFLLPIEFMADFRRVGEFQLPGNDVPHYPGVAALHVPLLAHLRPCGSKLTPETFWKIARQFGDCLDKNIDSPEVFEWIKDEASKDYEYPVQKKMPRKSPYVLSISNMGKIDGVLNPDVSDRVRLVDLHGHSSILVDDMPLFCLTTFALNGQFSGNVSFCTNYTTNSTAAKYVGLIQKYLCSSSNL